MKKGLCLILALVLCLSLCACSSSDNTSATSDTSDTSSISETIDETSSEITDESIESAPASTVEEPEESELLYNWGDSITTTSGMFIFTPMFDGIAPAVSNHPDENYLQPNGRNIDDSSNPYVADDGKVMMYYSAQVEYVGNSKSNEEFSFSAKLDYDNGYVFDAEGIRYSSDGKDWNSGYDTTSFEPLSSDTTRTVRFCVEVPEIVETDFEKRTVTIISIEGEDYTFLVDTKAAAEEKAAREAAAEAERIENMTEVDAALAQEIKGKLQGTWSFSVYGYAANKLYTTTHDLTFSGDTVSVQTKNTLLNTTMSNTGTYYVAKSYIVLNLADGSQACMPYTYEDGALNMPKEFEGEFYTA